MSAFSPKAYCNIWTSRRIARGSLKSSVLVVDDNRPAAEALTAYLLLENFDCRAVFSGHDAIEATSGAWVPEVVLMDISMPGCDGFEAAAALRGVAATANVVIIAFTAFDEQYVRKHERAQTHTFDGYLQKARPMRCLLGLLRALTV